MSKSTDSIIKIIKTGIDLDVSVESKSTDSVLKLIQALRPNQRLTIRDTSSKSTDSLIKIANIAKAANLNVTIVLDTPVKKSL